MIERLNHYLQGDEAAVEFCNNLVYISHLWDDLIDRDKARANEDINAAFSWLLTGLPVNRFFQTHAASLVPLMQSAIRQWHDSNNMEHGNADEQLAAFMLRNAVLHIIHHVMFLVVTPEWFQVEGLNFRKELFLTIADKFTEFKGEKHD